MTTQKDRAGALAVGMSGAALVASAIALANRKAKAAPGGELSLDQETMQLLIAMAQTSADIEEIVGQIAGALGGLGPEGEQNFNLQVQGYPPNQQTILSTRVQIAALNTPYQLPDIPVPEGMALQLKGWPTNFGTIYVGSSRATATKIEQAWPLIANESVGYFVQNAMNIFISGTSVNDYLAITVERRGR